MKMAKALSLIAGVCFVLQLDAEPWEMFDRRLGMFVHWGIYAVSGWHEQVQMRKGMSKEMYAELVKGFDAAKFKADDLVSAAESAGAEYIVITTKHHDGFCLWDTKVTDFNVMNSPCGRDLLKDISETCARRGMKLGFYYSNPDWNQPNAWNPKSSHQLKAPNPGDEPDMAKYLAFVKTQITELMTNYGKICCLFWDIPPKVNAPELNALVRKLQPGIEINDRGWSDDGDYSTPERGIPEGAAFLRKTESCDSVGAQSWGYRANEDYRTLGYLTRSIDTMLSRGGNYLLNIGPKADGTLAPESLACLKGVGAWYAKVRESYCDVEWATNLVADARAYVTRRGKTVYVHYPKGLDATGVDLRPLAANPVRATLLNTGAALKTEVTYLPSAWRAGGRPSLHVFDIPSDALANESVVLRLEFASEDFQGIEIK